MATNTSSPQQEANFLEEDDDTGSDEEVNSTIVPESHRQDTSVHYGSPAECNTQPQDELGPSQRKKNQKQKKNKT